VARNKVGDQSAPPSRRLAQSAYLTTGHALLATGNHNQQLLSESLKKRIVLREQLK
jgi:hypothetical protein